MGLAPYLLGHVDLHHTSVAALDEGPVAEPGPIASDVPALLATRVCAQHTAGDVGMCRTRGGVGIQASSLCMVSWLPAWSFQQKQLRNIYKIVGGPASAACVVVLLRGAGLGDCPKI